MDGGNKMLSDTNVYLMALRRSKIGSWDGRKDEVGELAGGPGLSINALFEVDSRVWGWWIYTSRMDDQGGGQEGTFAKEDVDTELDC